MINSKKEKKIGLTPLHLYHLYWAFIEAATFAARYNPRIHSWYEKKKRKSGVPKAKKALACKLAKAVFHVMNGKDFDEKMMFG